MGGEWLAVDWGTTNRRVYRIAGDGTVADSARDDRGVLAVPAGGFPDEVAAIRARFGDLPMLCAGMVGSNRGWVDVPYLSTPVALGALAQAVHWIEPGRTGIVPGVKVRHGDRSDVMRGEEVQLLGAVAAGLAPETSLLCQPGTHCKWAWMADGRIDRFVTAMTGELFSILRQHSLLSAQMAGDVGADADFRRGVGDAADGDITARLFGVRADAVSGAGTIADAASYVSGLLIGADVHRRIAAGDGVHILADPTLGTLYRVAIEAVGGHATLVDSHAAFLGGITRIWSIAR